MHWTANRDAGLARLQEFVPSAGKRYTSQRNYDDGHVDGEARQNVSQLSPWLRYRNHLHPAIHRAQDALTAGPEKSWSLAEIAACAHVSPRHLTRLFQQHLGISVRDYLEQLRLAVAEQWLIQGRGVEHAAQAAGFSSPRQFHRARQRAIS